MLGAIPSAALILYCNIFIGPAKLVEIPEGYTPEAYEYHSVSQQNKLIWNDENQFLILKILLQLQHPITRFMAKHMVKSFQQEYEIMCMHVYEEDYKQKLT